jgi:hypothetical protein
MERRRNCKGKKPLAGDRLARRGAAVTSVLTVLFIVFLLDRVAVVTIDHSA